jgi:hypothetical protein
MDCLKISDFCRKFNLPNYRFTRYKMLFHTKQVDGYVNNWVKLDEHNLSLVNEILSHKGTRRKKPRLSLEAFCVKYGLTDEHFKKVCHRMQLEDHDGQLMVIDSKHNYALLKHGRLIRKNN